jgi:hypothetical protein
MVLLDTSKRASQDVHLGALRVDLHDIDALDSQSGHQLIYRTGFDSLDVVQPRNRVAECAKRVVPGMV